MKGSPSLEERDQHRRSATARWDKVVRVRRRGAKKGFARSTSSPGLGPPRHIHEGFAPSWHH